MTRVQIPAGAFFLILNNLFKEKTFLISKWARGLAATQKRERFWSRLAPHMTSPSHGGDLRFENKWLRPLSTPTLREGNESPDGPISISFYFYPFNSFKVFNILSDDR